MDLGLSYPSTRLALGIVGLMLLADIVGLGLSGIGVTAAPLYAWLKGALGIGLILATCHAARWRLRHDEARGARRIKAFAERVSQFSVATLIIGAVTTAGAVFSYLGASTALPLQDAFLARLDDALGFDWASTIRLACADPTVETVLAKAYGSAMLQVAILIPVLALTGQARRLFDFVALFALTGFVTCLIFPLVPAVGAYFHYGLASPCAHTTLNGTLAYHADLVAIRSGAIGLIDLDNVKGLVTFPSFHTALALCVVYAALRTRFLALPLILVNALLIFATISHGGHYLIDIFGGAIIAAGAILFIRRLGRDTAGSTGPATAPSLLPQHQTG